MSSPNSDPGAIVVAGDVSIDWLAWPQPADIKVESANWRKREGTRMVARRGGALLLTDLLREATRRPVVGPPVTDIALKSPNDHLHSLVDLEPLANDAKRFRIARLRGFCGPEDGDPPQPHIDVPAEGAAVLVLDDSGNGFRKYETAWKKLIEETHPRWLIVKMARPLASGQMWDQVRRGPPTGSAGKPAPERLIVVVNADDLRAEKTALSRRLSWERTAEDFVRELGSNGKLAALVTGGHLIVRFNCEGVIHYHGHGAAEPKLYFDPSHAEGEFVDDTGLRMMGMTDAFTAGLAAALADDEGKIVKAMEHAIKRGMTAARNLAEIGFRADPQGAPDYPRADAMAAKPDTTIVALNIPSKPIAAGETWSILDRLGDDANYAARRVVTVGLEAALAKVPVARFGALATADRGEIESYRAIDNLLRDYLEIRQTKPISIAVFGPPGAGKSFGVKQVAERARPAGSKKIPPLEFNLSQFTKLDDLIAAFHLVRDQSLSGVVPLVFFDEFDSNYGEELEGKLGWLRYFLAPMQDGEFREAGHAHPLGAAIFVFAGGTRRTLQDFVAPMTKPDDDTERMGFAAVKGPDFASRLRGHIDIRGPNPVDGKDRMFPIRRAVLLRSMLPRREKRLELGNGFNIDEGVLNAFLTVGSYRHGARSMEAILAMSALTGRRRLERADLPPTEQLESHVDAADFMNRVKDEQLELREMLGRLLHEVYRKKRIAVAENDAERAEVARDDAMKDWDDLEEVFRESSRLQADDIPRKLRLIGCTTEKETPGRTAVEKFKPHETDYLAELEHERYNDERLRKQWQLGERDPSGHESPFLIPWDDLEPKWRSLDESAVTAIPEVLAQMGWRIYRTKKKR